jgi:hypothetical protein
LSHLVDCGDYNLSYHLASSQTGLIFNLHYSDGWNTQNICLKQNCNTACVWFIFTLSIDLKLHETKLIISVVGLHCLKYIVLHLIFKDNGTSGSSFKEGEKVTSLIIVATEAVVTSGSDILKGAPVSALVREVTEVLERTSVLFS